LTFRLDRIILLHYRKGGGESPSVGKGLPVDFPARKKRIFNVKQILSLLSALLISATFCSCVETRSGVFYIDDRRETFPKVENAHIKLEPFGPHDFACGVKPVMQFRVTNVGKEQLRVEEWFNTEERNLVIYYQDWLPDMKKPDPQLWMMVKPSIPKYPRRAPLDINPGTSLVIKAPLPFLENLQVSKGHERRFFVKAKLNLQSVDAETPVFSVHLY